MLLLPPWPDAERVVMAMLAGIPGVAAIVTATPAQFTGPTVQVGRIGGSDDFVTDYPRVQVAVFYPIAVEGDTDAAWALAGHIQQVIIASRNTTVGGALVDNAVTATPAVQAPYESPTVRRIVAVYQLAFRRPRT